MNLPTPNPPAFSSSSTTAGPMSASPTPSYSAPPPPSPTPNAPFAEPAWAQRLTELYFSGSTVLFALHGNEFTALPDFLAQQIFGRCDRTLHYDLGQVQR